MDSTSLKQWWKSRPARFARATVAAVVSLWAAYVVLMNVFLSTSLFDKVVNGDPITLDIHYARGWSVWPGTVHARDLSIRSSDSNVEWILRLDEVTFDVSFLALAERRFEVDRARGSGISMRVRQKLTEGPQKIDDVSSLAPVPGFPAFTMAPAGPHDPELWDDDRYALITVRLEDTVAEDVREIWVNDMRWTGHARIAGRFYLKPLRAVNIGPIHVDLKDGRVTKGRALAVVDQLSGQLDMTAATFDPRVVHDNEALRYFDVTTDLRATTTDLSKMPFAFPTYTAGVIDAQKIGLRLEKGALAPGTEIQASTPRLVVSKNDIIGYSNVVLHATVDDDKRLRADLKLTNSEVVRPDDAEYLHVDALAVRADSAKLNLDEGTPFEDVHVAAEIDNAKVANARLGNCLLPCTVRIHSGSAALSGLVEVWPQQKRAAASAHVKYDDVDVTIPALAARGSGDVMASFGSWRWTDTPGDGVVEGIAFSGRMANTALKAGDLRAKMDAGTLGVRVPRMVLADPMAALDASFVVDEADVEVASGAMSGGGHIDTAGNITLVDRKVASFDADVNARGGTFDGKLGEAHASARDVSGSARLTKIDNVTSGHADLVARGIGVTKGKLVAHANATLALQLDALANDHLSLGASKVAITDAKGTLDGKEAFTATKVAVDGRARNLDLKAPDLKAIDAHIAINDAAVPNAADLQPLISPKSKLRLVSGSATASGEVVIAGERGASGQLQVYAKKAGFALEKSTLVGDASFQAKVNSYDPETSTIDLSGTRLALRNVDVTNAAAETRGWHGDVVLDQADFTWADGTPALGADIQLSARDAKPVLGMLLRDHAPKLLAKLATMPDLALRGRLDADPDAIVLSDFYAHGGDVAFRGSYAVRDGDKSGAFVVSKAGVAMGLRVGNDGAHPKFFGLDQWLNVEEKKVKTGPKTEAKPSEKR